MPSVLVVGSINSDFVLRTGRLPDPGKVLWAGTTAASPEEKAQIRPSQSLASVRPPLWVGKTGADREGGTLKAHLDSEGVRTDFITCCQSEQTGLAVVTLEDGGRNSIVVIPGANHQVTEEDVSAALRAGPYDLLLLQLEIPPRTVLAACRLAEGRGIPVVLDAGPAQLFPLEELHGIHILTPNETETFVLSGIKPETLQSARTAAEILLRRSHAKAVVLKLGERGALLRQSDGVCEHFPAYPVEAIDTTAAGDAFTAAMAIAHARSGHLRHAVMLGNAAGALAAMNLGAQPSLPTASALEEFCSRRGIHGG